MTVNRGHARRLGFVLIVLAGVWFERSPWGERMTGAVLELQVLALDLRSPGTASGDADAAGPGARTASGDADVVGPGARTASGAPAARPLSPVMEVTLVVVGALVWWESRLLGWAVASSLAALAALLAVSTMMLSRGVAVPTAGPGLAIVAGVLGRRALEAVVAARDRRLATVPTRGGGRDDRPAHRSESHPRSGNLPPLPRKELRESSRTHVANDLHSREGGNDCSARHFPEGHDRHSREGGNDCSARHFPEGHDRHSREGGNPREPRRQGNFHTSKDRS